MSQPTTKILSSIMGNSQKLDGGAMFGNVPKAMWENWVTVDEHNRIDLACRALLVIDGDRNILFETGVGAFFEPKLRQRFGIQESEHVLLDSLASVGLSHEEIDVVVLSHLHFDHAGGLLSAWEEGATPELLFPNAIFIVGSKAWERANNPHPRDRASFIPALCPLLEASGRLELVDSGAESSLGSDYSFHLSSGHTPGMLLTQIETEKGPIVFAADLIPGEPWVHLPITMGYDRFPESLIDEKAKLLSQLEQAHGGLFFTHDSEICLGWVKQNEKGRYSVDDVAFELFELSV